jgi:hypothetical protein
VDEDVALALRQPLDGDPEDRGLHLAHHLARRVEDALVLHEVP